MYYSVKCSYCGSQDIVKATNKREAEALWDLNKPCLCRAKIIVYNNRGEYDRKNHRRNRRPVL